MTVKDIIDTILSREGLYRNIANPFSSTDLIMQENIRILNGLVEDLVQKNSLSELLKECTFVIEDGKEEYKFAELAEDCAGIDTGTMINLTTKQAMQAVNMHQWQILKASETAVGTTGIFNIRAKSIFVYPGLPAGTKISFLYYTNKPVIGTNGEIKSAFTSVSDTCLIPEQLLILGTVYKYLKDKDIGNWVGVEQEFNDQLHEHEAQGQAPQQIDLAGGILKNASNLTDGNWYVG